MKGRQKIRKNLKTKKKLKIRKKLIVIVIAAVLVLSAAGTGIYMILGNTDKKTASQGEPVMEGTVQRGNLDLTISASGTTAGTTNYQLYDTVIALNNLEIESTAVSAGDTVKKGDTLYTLTEESVSEAEESIELDLLTYQAEYKEAKREYADAVNEAKTEYEMNLSLASTAGTDYQDQLDTYQKNTEEKETQLKEAQEIIQNYPEKITSVSESITKKKQQKSTLQKQIKTQEAAVSKAQKTYDAAKKTYESAQSALNELETVAKYLDSYKGSEESGLSDLKKTVNSQASEKKTALQKAEKAYTSAQKTYESAKSKSDNLSQKLSGVNEKVTKLTDKKDSLKTALSDAKKNLTQYQAEYYKAVSEQTVGKVTARQTYEENMSSANNAKSTYNAAIKTAKLSLQTAKNNLSGVKKQKKAFYALVNGSKVQADRDGTLASVSYSQGERLNANTPLAGYQDSSVINIEVSVDQTDISNIHVGDEASVSVSSARGMLNGTVSMIEMESSSESVSSVSYTVVVTVDNSSGSISSDETAAVSFSKGTLENVLYIPVSAVTTEDSKSTVTVKQEDGTTKEVRVTLGENNGQYAVIENGLEEGDTYVVKMES